jgi:hypothetical protein
MFEKDTAAADAAFGFKPDDFGPVEFWPENADAVLVFRRMATQWRMSMAGPTGLDYAVLFRLLDDAAGDDKEMWYELLDDVSVMEGAALDAMRPKDD